MNEYLEVNHAQIVHSISAYCMRPLKWSVVEGQEEMMSVTTALMEKHSEKEARTVGITGRWQMGGWLRRVCFSRR